MVMPEHGWKSVPTEWLARTRGIGDQLLDVFLWASAIKPPYRMPTSKSRLPIRL
jgi:hypothetical protein